MVINAVSGWVPLGIKMVSQPPFVRQRVFEYASSSSASTVLMLSVVLLLSVASDQQKRWVVM